jgi:hypothetical protein
LLPRTFRQWPVSDFALVTLIFLGLFLAATSPAAGDSPGTAHPLFNGVKSEEEKRVRNQCAVVPVAGLEPARLLKVPGF